MSIAAQGSLDDSKKQNFYQARLRAVQLSVPFWTPQTEY
jgi:hypothetical protein